MCDNNNIDTSVHLIPFTLKISTKNFERLFGKHDLNARSCTSLKKTSLCEVLFNPQWHKKKKQLTPYDKVLNHFREMFNLESQDSNEFPQVVFTVKYENKEIKRFLHWFVKFANKKKIPLHKNNEYRMIFVNDTQISDKQLKKLSCVNIADKLWAVV